MDYLFKLVGFAEFSNKALESQTIHGTTGLFWLAVIAPFAIGFIFGVIYCQNQKLFKAFLIKKLDLSESKFAKKHFDDDLRDRLKNHKEK